MNKILDEIQAERIKQDEKWGLQNHPPRDWCMILGEEVGEVNKAALEAYFSKYYFNKEKSLQEYRAELVQVAAVAVAMIESLDRNELKAVENEKS